MWMVITQVVSVGPVLKSVVAVATIPLLVLPLHKEKQCRTGNSADPEHA